VEGRRPGWSELDHGFLTAVAEGEGTAKALQTARQQWLSEADNVHGHPYYWAGFVLMGDGEEIEIGKREWLWWFSAGMIVLGFGIWVMRRKGVVSQNKRTFFTP
jgi:hypothetical protein